jgi:HD-GYP domain-containing protein (c-di-GMP phosphodiesterase class II)
MKRILRERLEAREQERQEVHDKIDAELHTAGLQHFGESIAQRMALIEALAAKFNNDSRTIQRICLEVLDRVARILEPELQPTLDADSRRDMSIAAYLHDIGKSGPFGAPQATQEAIVKLYAVENVADPDQTIAETARANFSSEDAASMLERLGSCGLRSQDTMRAFWDRHGYWTHDILEADAEDIPVRARVIAGSHHMDRGIDPYEFSSDDYVDRLENRILMAVDKYQAATARSQKTHGEAMDMIKGILSSKYAHDVIMNDVLKVVDEIGREEALLADAA